MASDRISQFRASMQLDHEKWHDGTGYDLELLESATPEERAEIERIIFDMPVDDWRVIEVLNAIGSQRAKARIRQALNSSGVTLRMAIVTHAPNCVSAKERTDILLEALGAADFYQGLTAALGAIEEFHPPEIIDALFRGTLDRDGGVACHFAAMLMFVHGRAESSFDWEQRPFFLRFNTDDRAERIAAFDELCAKLGVDAANWHDRES